MLKYVVWKYHRIIGEFITVEDIKAKEFILKIT
jgi:hypothetical protein